MPHERSTFSKNTAYHIQQAVKIDFELYLQDNPDINDITRILQLLRTNSLADYADKFTILPKVLENPSQAFLNLSIEPIQFDDVRLVAKIAVFNEISEYLNLPVNQALKQNCNAEFIATVNYLNTEVQKLPKMIRPAINQMLMSRHLKNASKLIRYGYHAIFYSALVFIGSLWLLEKSGHVNNEQSMKIQSFVFEMLRFCVKYHVVSILGFTSIGLMLWSNHRDQQERRNRNLVNRVSEPLGDHNVEPARAPTTPHPHSN